MKGLSAGPHLRVHDGLYRLSRKGTSQNPEVCVIKVLAEHKGNSEFHPSNGEKVTTQETILNFSFSQKSVLFLLSRIRAFLLFGNLMFKKKYRVGNVHSSEIWFSQYQRGFDWVLLTCMIDPGSGLSICWAAILLLVGLPVFFLVWFSPLTETFLGNVPSHLGCASGCSTVTVCPSSPYLVALLSSPSWLTENQTSLGWEVRGDATVMSGFCLLCNCLNL